METDSSSLKVESQGAFLYGFYIAAILFNFCLILQVLTVGMAFFYDPEWWQVHTWLVRGYGGLAIVLAVWGYFGTFTQRIRALAMSLPILLAVQFLTIYLKTRIPLAIVHPLIGFSLFSASTTLVHRLNEFHFPKER